MFNNKKQDKPKRLSNKEFLSGYDSLWKAGPAVKYVNPDGRITYLQASIGCQNP